MPVSVIMATYNGQNFLKEQLDSIISQLNIDDELIIVDDCSSDKSIQIISEYLFDARIQLFQNPYNIGHVKTFSKLLDLASKDFIVMSDQDDVWLPGRLNLLHKCINSNKVSLVTSICLFVNDSGNLIIDSSYDGVFLSDSNKYFKNILDVFIGRQQYLGCLMIIDKKLLKIALPIPCYVESHDLWIAFAGNLVKSNFHLEEYTLYRRLHGQNASVGSRSYFKIVKSRIIFIIMIIHLSIRILKK
jgi:glycosyltransferase involved in cell wall biosynthesis